MKEIVVISGKGGTGKTSLTASLAQLGGVYIVAADCDVDAADMHLLLKPDFAFSEDFFSGVKAEIDNEKCVNCGKCYDVCRFNAIEQESDTHSVIQLNCEGCGYCSRICPTKAIEMIEQNVGKLYISKTKNDFTMVHARLAIGAENSGKLVAKVKNEAKRLAGEQDKDFVIVDGSPGVGCPVVSSLSGADFVLLVTEPSQSGFHDLRRVIELVNNFHIKSGCVVNKFDLNLKVTKQIEEFLKKEYIALIEKLPYDETFTKAMTEGQTIFEYKPSELKETIKRIWEKVQKLTNNKEES